MLLSETAITKWAGYTKKYYISKGYQFTKLGDEFEVKVKDLQEGSGVSVQVFCDYCLEEGKETILNKEYWAYIRDNKNSVIHKDCCTMCQVKKIRESNMLTYNVPYTTYLQVVKDGASFSNKIPLYTIIDKCKDYNIFFIDTFMKKNQQYIKFICNTHKEKGILSAPWQNIKSGLNLCRFCGYDQRKGKNHPNWQGGFTSLKHYLRERINDWKINSLKASNFKCVITDEFSHNLIVHHLIGFNTILQKVMEELNFPIHQEINNYSSEELNKIEVALLREHNKLLGVCLLPDIHNLFHLLYGFGDNTPEQFYEFKERCLNGDLSSYITNIKINSKKEII